METHNCFVCEQPTIEPFAHELCMLCTYCQNAVGRDVIESLRRRDIQEVYHQNCHDRKLSEDYKKKPVTITQAHLDFLNSALQLVKPNLELSVESNQQVSEVKVMKWMHEMNLDEKFYFVRMMEATPAMASITLSRDPKARLIAVEIAARDKERYEAVQEYRSNQVTTKQLKRNKQDPNSQHSKMTKEERGNKKAIAALEAIGFSEEQAIAQIQSQKPKDLVQ